MANQPNPDNQEIDLAQVSRRLRAYASRVNDSFFDGILFIKRNIIILVIIILIGGALGYYRDIKSKRYEHKLLVIPNFESTDYLYLTVDQIDSKIKQHDTVFFKDKGIADYKTLSKIEIEPVVEIYDFVDDPHVEQDGNDRKLQVFKLISENGDMEKVLKEKATSRNYSTHTITLTTKEKLSGGEITDKLLDYMNSDPYFQQIQQESFKNLDYKIAANDSIIKQIDAILNDISRSSGKTASFMYYDNAGVGDMIRMKEKLVKEQARNRIDRINYKDIIKQSSLTLNIKASSMLSGKMKYILPLLFVLVFAAIIKFRNYYRRQMIKRAGKQE